MVNALGNELVLQKTYLGSGIIDSIYFGGGTPSLLNIAHVDYLLGKTAQFFTVANAVEITLEANPDDLDKKKLLGLKSSGINRLSIGIQSFNDDHLQYLHRAHDAKEAKQCFKQARQAGFDNISIDLIYAIPSEDHLIWKNDLKTAIAMEPEHISAYGLTIEEKTVFGNWLSKGKIKAAGEDYAAKQYEMLRENLAQAGYEQYEVSNFSKPGFCSRHNSGYWRQEKYLGIGPSAHSYDQKNRQYNISNNALYMKAIDDGQIPFQLDQLETRDFINEYILTSLRTKWGCRLSYLQDKYGYRLQEDAKSTIENHVHYGNLLREEDRLRLTNRGMLLADTIISDLLVP